jgi:ABC-2 type transport system permease protein
MSWRQIYLVLKREYITRVRSKGFIWATILVPVGFAAVIGIMVFITVWESGDIFEVGIKDETGQIAPSLIDLNERRYIDHTGLGIDSLRTLVQQDVITGYIVITEENITEPLNPELIYRGSGGMEFLMSVESDFRQVIREERLRRAEVSEEIQEIYETRISLDTRRLTREGEEEDDDTVFLSFVGMILGIIIFISIFSYGGYITRGVIEEKTNRIIEVIASSVKPIELLTGKMAGVGALAITQFTIWILAFIGLSTVAGPLAMSMMDTSSQMGGTEAELPAFLDFPAIETSLMIYFILFFILGYLLYSSLFAAIGSAADSDTDTQQLMMPVTIPIMIAYFIMFHTWRSPDSMLSVVSSIIPFFSPILMVTRIAITDVPFWQIGASILLMVLTFAGTMWLSSKIYKVGILSYGSTASFKDIMKWIKQ